MVSYGKLKYYRLTGFLLIQYVSWLVAATPTSEELKLIGYGNRSLGIEVQVLSSSQNSMLQLNQQIYTKTIPGQHFSLQCGQKYYALNCGALTSVDNGNTGSLTVVIVPMENGVLLTSMEYDNKTTALYLNREQVVHVPLCQKPLAIVQTESMPRVWVVCIDGNTMYLFRMMVDLTILANSNVAGPLAQYSLSNTPTHLSNVIVATVWEEDYLISAIDDTILQISLEEQVIYKISHGLCSNVTLLRYVTSILHVYCSDSSIQYLNIDGGLITSMPPPPSPAVLVPCQNQSSVYLLLFAKVSYPYLTYNIMGANLTGTVNLAQWITDLHSWVCFGGGEIVHFAFIDNLYGLIVVTIDLGTHQCTGDKCIDIMELDSTACANQCKPLIVVNERWIVLERVADVGDSLVHVFDTCSNFCTVIEANHISIDFYTLLEYPLANSHTISASTTTIPFSPMLTSSIEVPPKNKTLSSIGLLVSLLICAVAFFIICTVIICALLCRKVRSHRKTDGNQDELSLTKHNCPFSVQVCAEEQEVLTTPVQETEI